MKSTISVARAGLLLFVAALPLYAVSGVTAWENTFHRPLIGAGNQSILASRELADGTTLTVVQDNSGITTLQYDHSGNLVQSATFSPTYAPQVAAIDPFGAVFVAADPFGYYTSRTDVWLMKFDGLTGAALWPAGVYFGTDDEISESVLTISVDPVGDPVVLVYEYDTSRLDVLKYSGTNGQLVWGPQSTNGFSDGVAMALDSMGNVYLDSGFEDLLTKYSGSTGALVWYVNGAVLSPSMGIDSAANLVIAGFGPSGSIEADKYDGVTGEKIWGPALWQPPSGYSASVGSEAVGPDGSVAVFGDMTNGSDSSAFVLKFRGADGALLWGPVTVANTSISSSALTLAGNGDVILDAQFPDGPLSDAKMWRYDGGSGSVVWGPQTVASALLDASYVASNGNVFAGYAVSNGSDTDATVLERDGATGALAWGPATFTGAAAGWTQLWGVATTPDGSVVTTGQVLGTDGNASWATLKYDRTTGSTIWGPVYFATGTPTQGFSPWGVFTDASGDVLVGGATAGGMSVVKYSGATGAQLWSSTVGSGAYATAFAVDPSGDAIIAGSVLNGGIRDVVTAKISGGTGATLWGPVTYDSGSSDSPDFLAADPSGNVILAGHSGVSETGFLIKYAAADGSILWGPTTQIDSATWLGVNTAGDLFREGSGFTTTKVSGSTGAVLWGPLSVANADFGNALAVDGAGDVTVLGSTYIPGAGADYAVIKYRGSDGAVLWGPVAYDSGGNDFPYKIVLDSSGNAVVTGSSDAGPDEFRTATLSYDGATGALLWGPVGRNIARNAFPFGLAASGSTVFVGATRGDVGYIVDAIDEALGIATLPGALPVASCGHALDIPLGAVNGTPPYAWSIVGGGLPPDVVLGASGDIIGMPSEEGVFAFRVQLQDSALATVTRDFTLAVGPSGPLVPVSVARDPATCQLTLSVAGSYAAYDWLPGGQSTPTITVDPTEPTPYGVILNDGSTCAVRGAVAIMPFDPSCLSPTLASISPASGPGAGTPIVVSGAKLDPAVALSIGGQPATGLVFQSASTLDANTPSLPPGTVADVLVVNPDGRYAMLLRSFASDFLDVSSSNPFYADIMKVLRAGITAGCGSGNYCSMDSVSRAQMAVFLLKAEHGFFHVPPLCTGVFADVPCPLGFAVNWIEELAAEGITSGCGGGDYCPDNPVTRAQMAVFLLKAEHGSSYAPPPCTGIFGDVPCPGAFADWIEQLFHEGITGGCGGGNYCPGSPNTRGQMAVFLTKTFNLP